MSVLRVPKLNLIHRNPSSSGKVANSFGKARRGHLHITLYAGGGGEEGDEGFKGTPTSISLSTVVKITFIVGSCL